jgi:hypothetical protein
MDTWGGGGGDVGLGLYLCICEYAHHIIVFCVYFWGGLECVRQSFAYVVHL